MTTALAGSGQLCLAITGRYPIVTCSGVVVRDEGNVSSTGLRIASASAAVVVGAAVAGAAYSGARLSATPAHLPTRISDSWLFRPLRRRTQR